MEEVAVDMILLALVISLLTGFGAGCYWGYQYGLYRNIRWKQMLKRFNTDYGDNYKAYRTGISQGMNEAVNAWSELVPHCPGCSGDHNEPT